MKSIGDTTIYESSCIGNNTSFIFNTDIDSIAIRNYDTSIFRSINNSVNVNMNSIDNNNRRTGSN